MKINSIQICNYRNGVKLEDVIPKEIFESKQSTFDFLESLPSFLVRMKLVFETIKNVSRPIDKNDYNDIAFLATAVPYCDDIKYNTIVMKDINDLLSL